MQYNVLLYPGDTFHLACIPFGAKMDCLRFRGTSTIFPDMQVVYIRPDRDSVRGGWGQGSQQFDTIINMTLHLTLFDDDDDNVFLLRYDTSQKPSRRKAAQAG